MCDTTTILITILIKDIIILCIISAVLYIRNELEEAAIHSEDEIDLDNDNTNKKDL